MDQSDIYIAVAADKTHPEDTLYSGRIVCADGSDGTNSINFINVSAMIIWRRVASFAKIISLSSFYKYVMVIVQKFTEQQLWVYAGVMCVEIKTGKSIQSVGRAVICDGLAYRVGSRGAMRVESVESPKSLRLINGKSVFECAQGVYRSNSGEPITDLNDSAAVYPLRCTIPRNLNGPHGRIYATTEGFYRIVCVYDSTTGAYSMSHVRLITWKELGIL
jgi:hypothetical protein